MTHSTPAEVAAETGMSARTVKRWCKDGKIVTEGKLGGHTGTWLIGPEGVEQAHRLAGLTRQLTAAHKTETAA